MTDTQYKLTPLQKTQSIPIRWGFSQDDYDKLVQGHRSNWCVFLRDDIVHVCNVGGKEFYRFTLSKVGDGTYVADSLETYTNDDFYTTAKLHGWTKEEVEKHQGDFRRLALEETTGLLASYFSIDGIGVSEN